MTHLGAVARVASWPVGVFLLAMAGASCGMAPGGWVAESGDIGSQGGAVNVFEPNLDTGGPFGPGEGQVGAPCSGNTECVTAYCMTTEALAKFIQGAVVADGYCSSLFCALDGSDAACTAEMGGVCFSLFAFLGEGLGEGGGICLRSCEDDRDCRADDDNVCFDVMDLVADGLISQQTLDLYYADNTRACTPRSVVEAAVAKLRGQ